MTYSTRGKEQTVSFSVILPEAELNLTGEHQYPAGYVELTANLINVGIIAAEFPTELRLSKITDGATELIDWFLISPELSPGGSVNIPLGAFLESGQYRAEAEARWLGGIQLVSWEFEVLAEENLAVNLQLLSKHGGIQPVRVDLANLGYLEFN